MFGVKMGNRGLKTGGGTPTLKISRSTTSTEVNHSLYKKKRKKRGISFTDKRTGWLPPGKNNGDELRARDLELRQFIFKMCKRTFISYFNYATEAVKPSDAHKPNG